MLKYLQITFQVHGRCGSLRYQVILQLDELSQLRVLLEPVSEPDVSDEVLRSLPRVHEVLAVVVVRVRRLGALDAEKYCDY